MMSEQETIKSRIAELEGLLKALKEKEEAERKVQEQAAKLKEAEDTVFVPFIVQEREICDDTEIFCVRLRPEPETSPRLTYYSGHSVGYFISRRYRRIIGVSGGGSVWLDLTKYGLKDPWFSSSFNSGSPDPIWAILKAKAHKAMDDYLASLPLLKDGGPNA